MKTVNTNKAPEALGPYSHATVVNDLVFTSGQIPLTLDGNIVSDDVQEQTVSFRKFNCSTSRSWF